ncbi:uncharacterized protein LOC119617159 [Kryptolebias marmoratus]|uniref:uncharacterized protein LOC119617159 n=1 Tax=Kryptolebias marmoratus TaxID=37003 RepID=UPI0018AD00D4|nr:uncharacterized protein LOC119617159 [Kryptolebias marmoratus]
MENSSSSSDPLPINPYIHCLITRPGSFIYTTFIVIVVFFFLPLFIFILYYGLQKWLKNCSNSSASALNHSDCFTYHLAIMELVGVFGCIISFGGIYKKDINVVQVGVTLYSFTWYGQGLFHILTCVEHYLAVVHPITYLTLREKRKLRIRNIIIGCVWLLCFVGMALAVEEHYIIMDSFVIILTVTITPFCSLSVLRVLNRSGSGGQAPWKEQVDQSKKRAFHTIVAILLVLTLRFAWSVVMTCEVLFNLPSNLVLPLLFLQRAGKSEGGEDI